MAIYSEEEDPNVIAWENQDKKKETTDTISFELTKVVKFKDLKPYGKFTIKWKTRQAHKHNIIPVSELEFNYEQGMPIDGEEDKAVVKFMKKHKTDILWDGSYFGFYTRTAGGFARVYHKKIGLYRDDEAFRALFED